MIPVAPAAPAAAPAAPSAQAKPSASPVKPNPVIPSQHSAGSGAPPPPKPEGTAPPERLTRKEKIDGKEVELTATHDELWAAYRKGSTLDRRFEENSRQAKEIAAERQRVEQMHAELAGDPTGEKLLETFMRAHPDADPVEVLSAILQKRMDEEEKLQDPNIRERRRLERENAEYKTKEQQAREQQEHAHQQQQVQEELNTLGQKFGEALALTKLPQNDITIRLMAEAESTNRKQGWNLSPQQLAAATEKSVGAMVESILSNESTTDDQLLAMFPAFTKRLHRAIVGRYKARGAQSQQQQPADLTPRERRPAEGERTGPRTMTSAEEHKAFGQKGLRTI